VGERHAEHDSGSPVTRSAAGSVGPAATHAFGARTDTGRVRATNEDRFVAHPPLFLVADGMGGQNAGEVAAAITADLLEAAAAAGTMHSVADLAEALGRANAAVWRQAGSDRGLEGMGTTCTAMIVAGNRLLVAHVGDSRAYLLRGSELRQLTVDHTLMQRLLDEGRLRPADIATHPQRSVIIRAIGAAAELAPDRLVVDLEPGDRLLLCSDGLSGPVPADDIRATLAGDRDPQAVAERLVDLANAAGGGDNVTAVVVDPDRVRPAAATGGDHPVPEEGRGRESAALPPSGRGRSGRRRMAVGALLLVLTVGIMGLAAAAVLAPSVPPAGSPAVPSATPPATPPLSPSSSPGASSASPLPPLESPPDGLPAPSPITGTAS
jgi:protein phosphatase